MAESCPIVKDDFSDENVYSYVELVVQNAECETKQVAEIKFKEVSNVNIFPKVIASLYKITHNGL